MIAMVLRRGDPDAGLVYVKALARNGQAMLYAQARNNDGDLGWRTVMGPNPEAEIDERLDRDRRIDSDLWAVEVLDDAMGHPFDPQLIEDKFA